MKLFHLMSRRFVVAIGALGIMFSSVGVGHATEMTFQFINDTDRAVNLKLFSRGESLQVWPSKSKAYSVRPNPEVQQLKISCTEGENICWGAWMIMQSVSGQITGSERSTSTMKTQVGVGERGVRECKACCHVCKDGVLTPVVKMSTSSSVGPDVR
jgi:hypothetical protein